MVRARRRSREIIRDGIRVRDPIRHRRGRASVLQTSVGGRVVSAEFKAMRKAGGAAYSNGGCSKVPVSAASQGNGGTSTLRLTSACSALQTKGAATVSGEWQTT